MPVYAAARWRGGRQTWYSSSATGGIRQGRVYGGKFIDTLLLPFVLAWARADPRGGGYTAQYHALTDGRRHTLTGSILRHAAALCHIAGDSVPPLVGHGEICAALGALLHEAAARYARARPQDLEGFT